MEYDRNKSLFPTIFLFTVIAIAVGTGIVIARSSGDDQEPTPTPEIVGQPVKSMVIITPPGDPRPIVKASQNTNALAPTPFTGYTVPEPKQYIAVGNSNALTTTTTPVRKPSPTPNRQPASAVKINTYENVSSAPPPNYDGLLNAQPATLDSTNSVSSESGSSSSNSTSESSSQQNNDSTSVSATASDGTASASASASQSSDPGGEGTRFLNVEVF